MHETITNPHYKKHWQLWSVNSVRAGAAEMNVFTKTHVISDTRNNGLKNVRGMDQCCVASLVLAEVNK